MLLMHLVLEYKHYHFYVHNNRLSLKENRDSETSQQTLLKKKHCDSHVINMHKIMISINLHKTFCKDIALKLSEMLILTLLFFKKN